MTVTTLLADLQDRNVAVTALGDSLKVNAPTGVLNDSDIANLRKHKSQILKWIRNRCRPHNQVGNYVDVPDAKRSGWLHTSCSVCGSFVGYRVKTDYTDNLNG